MKNEKVLITVEQEFSLEDLAFKMAREIDIENIPTFIAMLEAFCEDWETASKIISHFKAVEQKLKNDCPEEYSEEDFEPIDLLEGWNGGWDE